MCLPTSKQFVEEMFKQPATAFEKATTPSELDAITIAGNLIIDFHTQCPPAQSISTLPPSGTTVFRTHGDHSRLRTEPSLQVDADELGLSVLSVEMPLQGPLRLMSAMLLLLSGGVVCSDCFTFMMDFSAMDKSET
jgi:hypothetical protein